MQEEVGIRNMVNEITKKMVYHLSKMIVDRILSVKKMDYHFLIFFWMVLSITQVGSNLSSVPADSSPSPGSPDPSPTPGIPNASLSSGSPGPSPSPGSTYPSPTLGSPDPSPTPGSLDPTSTPGSWDPSPKPGSRDPSPTPGPLDPSPSSVPPDSSLTPGSTDPSPSSVPPDSSPTQGPPAPPPVLPTVRLVKRGPFPIIDFYNDSRIAPSFFTNLLCHTIRDRIEFFIVQPCCDCDNDCWKYGTCCIDKLWNTNIGMELEKYLQMYRNKVNKYKQTTCEEILAKAQNEHEIESLYMISTCPPLTDKQSMELCRNASKMGADGSIPVLGDDTYLYKNEYCAKCNNISFYEHQSLEVKCVDAKNVRNKRLLLHDLYRQKECIITLKRTSINKVLLKKCQKQVLKGNCSDREKGLCRIHQGRISNGYKNYFCWKCSLEFNHSAPISQLLQNCPEECGKQKNCFIPDNRDLSKYSYRFEITPAGMELQVTNFHQTFPIWDFVELPSSLTLLPDEGFEQYLCSGRRSRCCKCSEDCFDERKCCVDTLWNQTNPVDLMTYKDMLMDEAEKLIEYFCLPVYPPALDTQYGVTYRKLTKSCKRRSSALYKNNCFYPSSTNSPSMVVPVLGSDDELYANSFCAKCNFVNYTYVNLTLGCRDISFKDEDFSGNTTNGTFRFDIRNRTRFCLLDIVDAPKKNAICLQPLKPPPPPVCDYVDPRFYLCKSYRSVLENEYLNFHCRSCVKNDRVTKSMIQYCDPDPRCLYTLCTSPVVVHPHIVKPMEPTPFRWSLTLSFTGDTANLNFHDDRGTLQSHCDTGQYFNINQGKCVTISCPPGYRVSGLDCSLEVNLSGKGLGITQNVEQDKSLITREYFVYLQLVNEKVYMSFPNYLNLAYKAFNVTNNRTVFYSTASINQTSLKELSQRVQSSSNLYFDLVVIGMKINPTLLTTEYGLDFSRFFHSGRLCAIPVSIPYQIIEANATTFTYQNKTINITDLSYWISFQNNEMTNHYSICNQFHLVQPCARRLIPRNHIIKSDNLTIQYNNSMGVEMIYNAVDYFPMNTGYYVCLTKSHFLSTSGWTIHQDLQSLFEIEYYITIIGTSISIACYICIILTYVIFNDLRTIAGLNNCFMCLSLLIADVMALSSMKANENFASCFTVAIIMHWSLLAAFSWTLITAFDLVSRFGSLVSHSNENTVKKMIHRAAFGFLLPALVVAVAVALDESDVFEFGYGDIGICWRINNRSARIGFYVVPTALVTLIAMASLCYTIRKIASVKKATKKYIGSKGTSEATLIRMAMKLSIILGLTEVSGYIQIPEPNNNEEEYFNIAFGFTYTVFRSFRGVMLWLVYMHGGSVSNRYKKLLKETMSWMPGQERSRSTSEVPMSVYTVTN